MEHRKMRLLETKTSSEHTTPTRGGELWSPDKNIKTHTPTEDKKMP